MKKLFAILFLLGISYVGMSQSKYIVVGEENAGKENVQQVQQANPKLGDDNLYSEYEAMSMQLAKTNYYLDKYSRQALTGDVLIIAGSVFTSMAAFCESLDSALLCTVAGLGTGIAGYIVKLSAYNNLNSSRVKYDGFKVSYKL